ncbi:MAG: dihydrodipicolinate synthase family protein, partial [Eubacteriales bacterium]
MSQNLNGIYPALLTPFEKCGKVNCDALKKVVRWNINKGVNGFYVGGSTAEAFLLSEEERILVYKAVAEEARGEVHLIAH